jgi:hypothetical protein
MRRALLQQKFPSVVKDQHRERSMQHTASFVAAILVQITNLAIGCIDQDQ